MSLLSWGEVAEGANGAHCGHEGKSGAGKGGACDSRVDVATEPDGVS